MKAVRILMALAALATLSAAPAGGTEEAPVAPTLGLTCHETCRVRCIQLYPNNPSMQDRCTWSCIDRECGGGPFP